MFGTFQLAQLAFGGLLNGLYSVALLLVLVAVWRARYKMANAQQQWYGQWGTVTELCHKQLDEIKSVEGEALMGWMRSGWLTDLAARLDAHLDTPAPQETSEQMMLCAIQGKPFLFEQPDLSKAWERLPGISILLGLLGTFIGLTFALTQLPFHGNLKQLTGGLQQVLPLMGTAFWTSVCGLIASLLLRYAYGTARWHQETRSEAYGQLHRELTRRCLRELYPKLAREGLLYSQRQAASQAHGSAESNASLQEILSSQQAAMFANLEKLFAPLQTQLQDHGTLLQQFPTQVESLASSLAKTSEALGQWQEKLSETSEAFAGFSKHASEAMEPIAHTERLLSERISALTRQHEALTESLEAVARREREFPEKLREVLKLSLRPAHEILQRTTRSLQSSLELVFERDAQEREVSRRLFQDLGDRFSSIDRLATSLEKNVREIAQISDTLADLSNRLRFRLATPPPQDENQAAENTANERALDAEIEQLLEEFDAPSGETVAAPPPTSEE